MENGGRMSGRADARQQKLTPLTAAWGLSEPFGGIPG